MIITCPHCGSKLPSECLKEVQDTAVVSCQWCGKAVRIVKRVQIIYEVNKDE